MSKRFAALLLTLLFSGCSFAEGPVQPEPAERQEGAASPADFACGPSSSSSSPATPAVIPPARPPAASSGAEKAEESRQAGWVDGLHPYLYQLVQQALDSFYRPGMSEYERAKAAFDYMIDHTVFDEPVGQELWRIHGGGDTPIPYLQQKALSPLRFSIGMCEDYAAALTLLLRGMGLSAEYVPGLTYSAEGHLVDHAWTAVCIEGTWYHLDSQLEDNVSRHGAVRYRYFLLGDATLVGSHRWGQNLIDSGLLTQQQNEEIRQHYLLPVCPRDYPRPERRQIENRSPDKAAAHRQAQAELAEYTAQNGPLPPMELTTIPPVFGCEGYGPADEG